MYKFIKIHIFVDMKTHTKSTPIKLPKFVFTSISKYYKEEGIAVIYVSIRHLSKAMYKNKETFYLDYCDNIFKIEEISRVVYNYDWCNASLLIKCTEDVFDHHDKDTAVKLKWIGGQLLLEASITL